MLPRTNSDLLQADTMTVAKVEKYGARIMDCLKPFWKEVDGGGSNLHFILFF